MFGLRTKIIRVLVMAGVLAFWQLFGANMFLQWFPQGDNAVLNFGYVMLGYVLVIVAAMVLSSILARGR